MNWKLSLKILCASFFGAVLAIISYKVFGWPREAFVYAPFIIGCFLSFVALFFETSEPKTESR